IQNDRLSSSADDPCPSVLSSPTSIREAHLIQEPVMSNRIPCTILGLALAAASAYAFAAPVTYTIDPTHTDVVAQWNHLGFSNPIAHFGQVEGIITYDADNVAASSVEVILPLAGLSSHVKAFDDHLRSDDFFDAAKYPQATF